MYEQIEKQKNKLKPTGGKADLRALNATFPMQMQVNNFSSAGTMKDLPRTQLEKEINANAKHITTKGATLKGILDNSLNYLGNATRVDKVKGTVRGGRPNGQNRTTSHTSEVGAYGRDELLIKQGWDNVAFEGGHIISKSLWDANDADDNKKNTRENLVPMSRGMNIYTYLNNIETEMGGGAWRIWTIDPTYTKYDVPEKHIAKVFGLSVGATNGDNTLTLDSWIPQSITGTKAGFSAKADESGIYSERQQADTGAELKQLLEDANLTNYVTDKLMGKINGL